MRFIGSLDSEQQSQILSDLYKQHNIEYSCEVTDNRDWGDDDYGVKKYHIWVVDEDQYEKAQELFTSFIDNPEKAIESAAQRSSLSDKETPKPLLTFPKISKVRMRRSPLGMYTLYLFLSCVLLFIWSEMTTPNISKLPQTLPENHLPLVPIFNSPVKKNLMYDYPRAFVFVDKIVSLYGVDKALNPSELPSAGQYLVKEFEKTPYWKGLYEKIVAYFRDPSDQLNWDAPMFEKIQEGEVWRLFTPCLLHNDILHIFFNMFWLLILGNQIELRVGRWPYLFFIVATAIFSNTAQYLMTGSNFIGFSGVLCAMFAFIWVRQRFAPWEGYQLDRLTIGFITVFILGMVALQLMSFYLEIYHHETVASGVANTAHLSGALIGALLGRWNFFAWKQ